jgi:hypothetical protein
MSWSAIVFVGLPALVIFAETFAQDCLFVYLILAAPLLLPLHCCASSRVLSSWLRGRALWLVPAGFLAFPGGWWGTAADAVNVAAHYWRQSDTDIGPVYFPCSSLLLRFKRHCVRSVA